jgi:hypothetical protein
VSEIAERLWAEYEGFCKRDLAEHAIVYLFVDGIAERLRPGQTISDPVCSCGAPGAFNRRPLSRAYRPFIGPPLRGR